MSKSDADPLYQVPLDYEALLGADGADLPFYVALAGQASGPVLDLATGTGRVALAVAAAGVETWGVDLSPAMLAVAASRAQAAGLAVTWLQGDLRTLNLGRRFALALLPYNGLQHLHTAADLDGFFSRLREHLAPGGRLALDLHLPQPTLLARDPDEWYGVLDGPATADGWRVAAERSAYDPAAQVLTQTWRLLDADGAQRDVRLALRQFFPQELRGLLARHGFQVLRHDGGFEAQPLRAGARKQVLVAQLPG